MVGVTKSAALELAPFAIRFVSVDPAFAAAATGLTESARWNQRSSNAAEDARTHLACAFTQKRSHPFGCDRFLGC